MRVHFCSMAPHLRWLVLLCAVFSFSCSGGPRYNPVKGSVIYQKKPLVGAGVIFKLKGGDPMKAISPSGTTDEEGNFTLSTGPASGAPAGDYDVMVNMTVPLNPTKSKSFSTAPPETKDLLAGKYSNPKNPLLHAQIKDGQNQLEPFVLE